MHYQYTSIYGKPFNYWLPIYINESHFKRARAQIEETISTIACGVVGVPFSPLMVLKVIPPILTKAVIAMLQDDLCKCSTFIDAYTQFHNLLLKFKELYPVIQEQIDNEVESFLKEETFRYNRNCGDLGEFLVKQSLSQQGFKNHELNKLVLSEFFSR